MPTIPSAATVLHVRYVLVVASRVFALLAILFSLYQSATLIIATRLNGPANALIQAGFAQREPIAEPLQRAAVPAVLGVLLALAMPKLAMLCARLPKPGCPFCDHRALPETGTRCPECGRALPEQLLARPTD